MAPLPRLALVLLALAAGALPAQAAAQSTSNLRTLVGDSELPPTTDGDRYVIWGSRAVPSVNVVDTVIRQAGSVGKPAGCGWSVAPRAAFRGAVVLDCFVPAAPPRHVLLNLRTGAQRALPPAIGYAAVGRAWLHGWDAQGDFFVRRAGAEVRRVGGLRDLDDPRLRGVCRRITAEGGARPATLSLAYDRRHFLTIGARGLLLRPCARRRRAVRLERGAFAGFELPDFATLASGFVTWTSVADPPMTLGYDVRTRRRWAWSTRQDSTPLHTRNALLVRTPTRLRFPCGGYGDCEVAAWVAETATIRRSRPRAPARRPARRGRRS